MTVLSKPMRLIFDTDIGSDVDDALALALVMASQELALEAVTVVTGDIPLRRRIALKILDLAGRSDVPVIAGAARPMIEHRPVWLTGDEGGGLSLAIDPPPMRERAPEYIVRTVMDNPGTIHIAAMAPLTNIAMALLLEPEVARNVGHIWIMGGSMRGVHDLSLSYAESNIDYDPAASSIVFCSGAPISLVPLDVTLQVPLDRATAARIGEGGTLLHTMLVEQFERFVHVQREGFTHMHDPLTVALMIDRSLVEWRDLHVDIETVGRYTLGTTLFHEPTPSKPANARVAMSVDEPRFTAFLIERLRR